MITVQSELRLLLWWIPERTSPRAEQRRSVIQPLIHSPHHRSVTLLSLFRGVSYSHCCSANPLADPLARELSGRSHTPGELWDAILDSSSSSYLEEAQKASLPSCYLLSSNSQQSVSPAHRLSLSGSHLTFMPQGELLFFHLKGCWRKGEVVWRRGDTPTWTRLAPLIYSGLFFHFSPLLSAHFASLLLSSVFP